MVGGRNMEIGKLGRRGNGGEIGHDQVLGLLVVFSSCHLTVEQDGRTRA